jgi:hypothetical protein
MTEEAQKERVVLGRKKLKFFRTTDRYERLDCFEGGPTSFTEKHYLPVGVEIPKDVVIHCVYFYEK